MNDYSEYLVQIYPMLKELEDLLSKKKWRQAEKKLLEMGAIQYQLLQSIPIEPEI